MSVRINLCVRDEACKVSAHMREGRYWAADFSYPTRRTEARNLSGAISQSYGLDWQSYRVHLGDFEFAFSRHQNEDFFRLNDIYAYSDPKDWQEAPLDPPPAGAAAAFFQFQLPAGEPEVLASLNGALRIVVDWPSKRCRLAVDGAGGPAQWFHIADNAALAVDMSGALTCLQFEDFAAA